MKQKVISLLFATLLLASSFVLNVSASGEEFRFPIDVEERYTNISYVDETNVLGEVVTEEEESDMANKKTVYVAVLSVLLVASVIVLIVTLKRAKNDKLLKDDDFGGNIHDEADTDDDMMS
ncbi:MAG: hypothetical protein IKC01_02720 [Clostridia bacterium]|nr:hypothetical protein [Clostridia bacterium]